MLKKNRDANLILLFDVFEEGGPFHVKSLFFTFREVTFLCLPKISVYSCNIFNSNNCLAISKLTVKTDMLDIFELPSNFNA